MLKKTILYLMLCFVSLGGKAVAQVITSKDLTRLKSVSSVAVSPDGRHVAYRLSVQRDLESPDFEDGPAYSELHVLDTNGRSRPFVTGEVVVGEVSWVPGGREIAFLAKRAGDEHKALYAIPVDGGEARKILEFSEGISAYSFSPDGYRIAFLSKEPKAKEAKNLEELGFNQEVVEEQWQNTRLYIGSRDKSTKGLRPVELTGSVSEIHWSPRAGDDRLVLALAPNPSVDAFYMYRRLQVVDASGRSLATIANPGKLGHAAWSPDGKHIAFLTAVDLNDPHNGRLWVADSQTGRTQELTPDLPGEVKSFDWIDNTKLVGVGSFGADSRKMSFRLGSKYQTIPSDGNIYTDLSAGGGRIAYLGNSPRFPSELFLGNKRMTTSNPWLAGKSLATQEVLRHTTKDGVELEGILIHPLNEVKGQKYPLILAVHGGPESHRSNGWLTYYSLPGQVAAAQGFAVFYPNYRGSTGRGVPFAKLSQGDPAGKEFDDLVEAVDFLVGLGLVDKSKVGITGGSYGGYASAWGATYFTERFAASVMFVGISDKISKVGTTDIPDEEFHVHARKRPWDNFEFFFERSPIRYVEQAKTPILIMHGKDDPRVHPAQSMELFRFLKSLGKVPVRLVMYPGEGHGNRKAAARYDYSLRMMRWMNHYLKGPGGEAPPLEIDYDLPKDD